MAEVPWFTSPPDAQLSWGHDVRDDLGYLRFTDPNGKRCVVWVSASTSIEGETFAGQNVWHIDVNGNVATVSPSIHFVGHFHTPRPVVFRLVDVEPGTVTVMPPTDTPDQDPAPLSGPHEQAVGVETDPSVLAAPAPDQLEPSQTVPDAPARPGAVPDAAQTGGETPGAAPGGTGDGSSADDS